MDTQVIIGRVLRTPEVRTAIDGKTLRTIPVLQIELHVDGQEQPVCIEQEFPFCELEGAYAASRRYRPGRLLQIDASPHHLQLTYRKVAHIHLLDKTS